MAPKGQIQTPLYIFPYFLSLPAPCAPEVVHCENELFLIVRLKRKALGNQKYHENNKKGRAQESKPIKLLMNNLDHPPPVHVWI